MKSYFSVQLPSCWHCKAAAPANWNISVSLLHSHLTCFCEGKSGEVMMRRGPRGTESCSNFLSYPSQQQQRISRGKTKSSSKTSDDICYACVLGNNWDKSSKKRFGLGPAGFHVKSCLVSYSTWGMWGVCPIFWGKLRKDSVVRRWLKFDDFILNIYSTDMVLMQEVLTLISLVCKIHTCTVSLQA